MRKNLICRKFQKLEHEIFDLRSNLSQVTAMKEKLSNEAYQFEEKFQEVSLWYIGGQAFIWVP